MSEERQERIRERAHAIWEREGRPEGRDHEHWQQATAEIDGEGGGAAEANAAMNQKAGKSGAGRGKRAGGAGSADEVTAANEAAEGKAGGGRKRGGEAAAGMAALGEKVGSVRTAKRAASPKPMDEPATGKRRSPKPE